MKVIIFIDVCTDRYNGYWERGVYYPGVGDIGKIVNLFDCKVNDVVWGDRKDKGKEGKENKNLE